jgi:hypothetical protein
VDTLITFVVTISGYVIIFVVIGFIFYYVDKRVKAHLRKPARCTSCKAEVPAGVQMAKGRLCASCAEKKSKKKGVATHR